MNEDQAQDLDISLTEITDAIKEIRDVLKEISSNIVKLKDRLPEKAQVNPIET